MFIAVLALGATIYLPTLSNPFVFDDHALIEHNSYLRSAAGLQHLLTRAGWTPDKFSTFYRPVTMASLWLTFQGFGAAVWSYRLGNLLFHLINAFLLGLLFERLQTHLAPTCDASTRRLSAAFASLLFLLHPVYGSGVFYLHKRSMLLFAIFYSAATLCFLGLLYARSNRRLFGLLAATLLCFALALGSRESAVTLPLTLSLLAWLLPQQRASRAQRLIALTCCWIGAAIYLANYNIASVNVYKTTPWQYLLQQATVIPRYCGLLLWPRAACISYAEPATASLGQLSVLLGGLSIATALGLAIFVRKRAPLVSFAIVWFLVVISPASSIVPTNIPVDHIRLYLASAPLLLLVARAVVQLGRRLGRPTASIALAATLLLTLAAENLVAGQEYRSSEALWRKVVDRYPDYWRGWSNLCALTSSNESSARIERCRRAIALNPGDLHLYVTLADAFVRRSDNEGARSTILAALDAVASDKAIDLARALVAQRALSAAGAKPTQFLALAYLLIDDPYYRRISRAQLSHADPADTVVSALRQLHQRSEQDALTLETLILRLAPSATDTRNQAIALDRAQQLWRGGQRRAALQLARRQISSQREDRGKR